MKKLFANETIYEILLTLYFSDAKEISLGTRLINLLDEFINFYKAEDGFNNTENFELIKRIYSNQEFDSRDDMLRFVAFSETALYRFRMKIVARLEKHLNGLLFQENNISESVI